MASGIREPTKKERSLATTISGEGIGIKEIMLSQAEDKGFRTIRYDYQASGLSILTPSKKVLEWDLNPRSLDSLKGISELELSQASIYLGAVYSSILPTEAS